jgi:drug/metabolite transporter (DMT)-like permease
VSRANIALSVVAAAAAAAAYGAGAALEHDQAGRVEQRAALDPGLLGSLVRRPLWLAGIAADAVAFALQGVALRFGPVVLVQLLLVAALPAGVVVSALLAQRRLNRPEALGVALCAGGLALAVPGSTLVDLGGTANWRTLLAAGVAVAAVTAALLLLARMQPARRPLALGTAAGVAAGTTSVLLAACAAQVTDLAGLVTAPALYGLAVFGVLAVLLTQAAFQTGDLTAPWAALSVCEPVVAVVLALGVLHERLPSSALALVAGAAGALAAVAGVLVLGARTAAQGRSGAAAPVSRGS